MLQPGAPWALVRRLRPFIRRVLPEKAHAGLDFAAAAVRSQYLPVEGFFADGWGNPQVLLSFVHKLTSLPDPAELNPVLTTPTLTTIDGVRVTTQEGTFTSPIACEGILPPESHTACFKLVTPVSSQFGADIPTAIILAGTGEHGYSRRCQLLAQPLAQQGVASLILESPLYGQRRPAAQMGSKLRCVSDLPVLGYTTIEETRGLVRWLRSRGGGPVVLTGSSMGGLHSAMVASLLPNEPLGVVSWFGPPSADPVFTKGLLARACEWKSLVGQEKRVRDSVRLLEGLLHSTDRSPVHPDVLAATHKRLYDDKDIGIAMAKQYLATFFTLTDVTSYKPPARTDATVFVVGQQDQFVPASDPLVSERWELLKSLWPGIEVRSRPCGHATGILLEDSHAETVVDVLHRLQASP